ncbi:fructose 1,6-bisphosphatase [Candidatus Roizmanbacteria bacterium RIFOXYC2_FULL_41_10]|nr:MAG: fructose 1,6-bisphosphatase [Candidatus Roizmanbacteria bacterium RIFOXYC2_FULL_41_10]
MKITLSLIKADIGSVGGHTKPSEKLLNTVLNHVRQKSKQLLIDYKVFYTGDDIAILMSHKHGVENKRIHKLAWDAFILGTKIAKSQGLYGAGQDILKDSFSGNVKGMGPAVAEIEFKERENETILVFTMDKTEPGAFNLPFYFAFADPMWCPGLMLAPPIMKGFTYEIIDTEYLKSEKTIRLNAPEDLYDIACLLRETRRYVIKSIWSREYPTEQAVAVSITRLKHIAGRYVGKDDPVAIVRAQKIFPATEEVGGCFRLAHYVGGDTRGSHNQPLMPVKFKSPASVHYCIPIVQGMGISIKNGVMTEHVDLFDEPFWDYVRERASIKSIMMRDQGFVEPSMVPRDELEYGGIVERLAKLEKKFKK